MCGRFTIQYTWAEYHDALNLIPASAKGRNDPPRYNVCPTQKIGFVYTEDGETVVKDGVREAGKDRLENSRVRHSGLSPVRKRRCRACRQCRCATHAAAHNWGRFRLGAE